MISGKIWGRTELLCSNSSLEFHRIEVKKGGKCSKHKHNFKSNLFFVENGKLLIRVWKSDYELTDETILSSGETMEVQPGEFHQFEALEDTIGFELYFVDFAVIHNDIHRESVGSLEKGI